MVKIITDLKHHTLLVNYFAFEHLLNCSQSVFLQMNNLSLANIRFSCLQNAD